MLILSMSEQQRSVFTTITIWLLTLTLVLVPIVVLPLSDNFIIHSKMLLASLVALALGLVSVLQLGFNASWKFRMSPVNTSVIWFFLAVLLSSFTASRYPTAHLLGLGGLLLSSGFIAVFGSSLLPKKDFSQTVVGGVSIMAVLLSISTFLQLTGFGPSWLLSQATGIPLANNAVFSLTGSNFITAQVLVLSLLVMISYILKKREIDAGILASGVITLAGAGVTVWLSMPGQIGQPQYVPYLANWSIALDVLRVPRTALVGIGPEFFADAYNIFKPLWLNSTPIWNSTQIVGSNMPLHLLTTTGLLGFGAWLVLFVQVFRTYFRDKGWMSPSATLVAGSLAVSLFFPINMTVLLLMSVGLAFWIAEHSKTKALSLKQQYLTQEVLLKPQTTAKIVAVIGLVLLIWIGYWQLKNTTSQYLLFRSTQANLNNQVTQAYNLQQAAVRANPFIDETRRRYAQTNLAIAAALSNKANPTEQEQAQINQLIQQAIRETRAATSLRPTNTQNWQASALIYQNLLGVAEGADQWTISSYVEAINTSPNDPLLRASLGQVFVTLQNFNSAAQVYNQALSLKPDLIPVRYQFARSLVAIGALPDAAQQYQLVLQALSADPNADSDTINQVTEELTTVEAQIEEFQTQAAASGEDPTIQGQGQQPALFDNLGNTEELEAPTEETPLQQLNLEAEELNTATTDPDLLDPAESEDSDEASSPEEEGETDATLLETDL